MTISLKHIKERLLGNPEVRSEYDRLAPEFEVAGELVRARTKAGLSQVELATRMGTTQSEIARIESGRAALRTTTIYRYADALGLEPQMKLVRKKPRGRHTIRTVAAAGNKPTPRGARK